MFLRRIRKAFLLFVVLLELTVNAYDYDPTDFATEVIEYVQGDGLPSDQFTDQPFNDPNCALGRPTVDTTGDLVGGSPFEPMTIVPLYPAFRYYEVVSIGHGGRLILKFEHAVEDDKRNPYGIDFIIFGNSYSIIDSSSYWHQNDDPRNTYVTGPHVHEERGIVSVSQDGRTWYTFAHDPCHPDDLNDPNDPYADDFAPTLGRVYDRENPDPCAFAGNLYWGQPTNPTLPIDPNLSCEDFENKALGEICELYYGQSAGGTGFDISRFDLPKNEAAVKWIQYVRIHNPRSTGATPEIDAVADVAGCGDRKHRFPEGDINEDCRVDFLDFAVLAGQWRRGAVEPSPDIAPEGCAGMADLEDISVLVRNWLECTWDCE